MFHTCTFVFVMLLWLLLTVGWLRSVAAAAAAAVATLLRSFEWILSEDIKSSKVLVQFQ